MRGLFKDILTKSDITASFTSSEEQVLWAKRFLVYGSWTAASLSAAVVASGDIDTEANTFAESSHELLTGMKVRATTAGTLPSPLALSTDYFVIRTSANTYKLAATVDDAVADTPIDITSIGVGNQTITPQLPAAVVVPSSAIVAGTDTFTLASHKLVTGMKVQVTTSDTLPTGLSLLTDYFVVKLNEDDFKLSDTLAHALAATDIIDITDAGVGNQTFTAQAVTASVVASGAVDSENNSFTKASHGFLTGVKVAATTGTTLPTGLSATNYYIIKISDSVFKVAASLADAIAGTPVDITDQGVGNQTFTPASAAATIKVQACASDPDDPSITPQWFDVSSAESISATGVKLWEFVDKAYSHVRLAGTITGGSFTWDALIRAEWHVQ